MSKRRKKKQQTEKKFQAKQQIAAADIETFKMIRNWIIYTLRKYHLFRLVVSDFPFNAVDA